MFIESLIKRKKGTTVELGNNTYLFNDGNDHTCEVTDENDIERLLSIVGGFKEVVGAQTEERAELVEKYIAKFGKAPHPRAGIAKIKAELESEQ